MRPEGPSPWRQLAALSMLGATFVACIAVGTAAGILLDRWLNTSPWLTLVFFGLGVAAAFVTLFRDVRRWQEP